MLALHYLSTLKDLSLNPLVQKWLKNGPSRPLFPYFRSFHIPIQITNLKVEKSVAADDSIELWRQPIILRFKVVMFGKDEI